MKNIAKRASALLFAVVLIVSMLAVPIRADAATTLKLCAIQSGLNTQMAVGAKKSAAQLVKVNKSQYPLLELRSAGGKWYYIVPLATNQCMTVVGGKKGNGVKVQWAKLQKTKAQQWQFVSCGKGYCYIQNRLGYYLNVQGGKAKNGAQLETYKLTKKNAQKWYVNYNAVGQMLASMGIY